MADTGKDAAHIAGWKINAPEGVYNFDDYKELGSVARIAISAVLSFRSTNDSENARKRSNLTEFKRAKHFLTFAKERSRAGCSVAYDRKTFTAYSKAAEVYRPITEHTYVAFARRLFRFASDSGETPAFDIPPPKNQKVALATVKDRTIADSVSIPPNGTKDRIDLNHKLLAELADWCWRRIHEVRDRFELAQAWLCSSSDIVEFDFYSRFSTREEAIQRIVTYLWGVKNGYMPQTRNRREFLTSAEQREERARRRLYEYLQDKCGEFDPPITVNELEDYMKPSHRQICAFLPLFSIIGINPVCVFELETSMLVEGPESGTKAILWTKYRANREIQTDAWRVMGRNARTVPNAWNILEAITDGIRRDADATVRKYLFLCSQHRTQGKGASSVSPLKNYVTMRVLNTQLRNACSKDFPALRSLSQGINLKMIRTTAGVLERFDGDFKAAQRFFEHKQAETTDGYLNSPTYRAFLDDKILEGIDHLYDCITDEPKLLPDNVDAIVEQEGLTPEVASALVADELNVGYGISLTQEGAYVIDTPLNYLRMQKMLQKIEDSAERLEIENPERWERYWKPQIPLYERALDDFPRRTREASKTLLVNVAIPELY